MARRKPPKLLSAVKMPTSFVFRFHLDETRVIPERPDPEFVREFQFGRYDHEGKEADPKALLVEAQLLADAELARLGGGEEIKL